LTRRMMLIAAGVAVLVLVGWYVVLWSPKGAELGSAKAAIAKADTSQLQLLSEIAGLKGVQRNLPAEVDGLNRSLAAVPVSAGIPALIDQLQQAANGAGVTVTTESQSMGTAASTTGAASTTPVVVPTGAASTVSLNLNVTGSYSQVLEFVGTLEQSPRSIVVDTLNLTAADGVIQATIDGRAFYNPTALPDVSKIGAKA
jgi:Tfp pilus assembly protein PilO